MMRPKKVPQRWKRVKVDTASQQESLRQLAAILAKNHLHISIPRFEDARVEEMARRTFADTAHAELARIGRTRVVVVVGAGLSAGAFGKAYPTTIDARNHIADQFGFTFPHRGYGVAEFDRSWSLDRFIQNSIARKLQQMDSAYDFNAWDDFESCLSAMAEVFGEQRIRAELQKIYRQKFEPHLSFEILAHLLKHRFVDTIVNFNFDELLDLAIAEEIGQGEYHFVYSDGHCRALSDVMVGKRLKIPLHIKPHGTVSHPSTMRFTKDHYHQLPLAMRTFLEGVVGGYRVDAPASGEDRTTAIAVIAVGFSMRSLDFNSILKRISKDSPTSLYVIDNETGFYPGLLEDRTGIPVSNQFHISTLQCGDSKGCSGVAGVLRNLWSETDKLFVPSLRPRHISRHEIVHSLFYRDTPGTLPHRVPVHDPTPRDHVGGVASESSLARYAYARMCVELAIELARGNGRVAIDALAKGLVGRYATLVSALSRNPQGFDAPLTRATKEFEKFGGIRFMRSRRYSGRVLDAVFRNLEGTEHELTDKPSRPARMVDSAISIGLAKGLCAVLREIDSDLTASEEGLAELFKELARSDASTIHPRFDHHELLLTNKPDGERVLHTNLSVGLAFLDLVVGGVEKPGDTWDLMLVASNRGKLLDRYAAHAAETAFGPGVAVPPPMASKRFAVVVPDVAHHEALQHRFNEHRGSLFGPRTTSGNPSDPLYYLRPFWATRRSFVVLMKRNFASGDDTFPASEWPLRPVGAIEFLGDTDRSNPVRTDDAGDLERLSNHFFGYVCEAVEYMKKESADGRNDSAAGQPGASMSPGDLNATVRPSHIPDVSEDDIRKKRMTLLREWAALIP